MTGRVNLFSPCPSLSSSSCSIVMVFLFVLVFLCFSNIVALNATFPAVILFGDSIVDQGNNNYLRTFVKCDFPPYGKDFPGGVPTGRFCNGKTPADLIAQKLGIKEFVPAYLDPNLQPEDLLTGVSFASGGTGFDPETSTITSVLSPSDQLQMFREYIVKLESVAGEEKTSNILANGLFLLVAGTNDLTNTYFTVGQRRLQYDVSSYADFLAASASQFTKEIYKLGARKILVFGAPPIGCLPVQRTLAGGVGRECVEPRNQAAQLYNSKLSAALDSLNRSLNKAEPKSRVIYVDIYSPLLDIIQNHKKYGFAVVDKGCCGTGKLEVAILCNKLTKTCPDASSHLFWDIFHPTEKGYRVILDKILP
ncbi:Triacylglycerol lipase, partial [Bertholletia excelsa]